MSLSITGLRSGAGMHVKSTLIGVGVAGGTISDKDLLLYQVGRLKRGLYRLVWPRVGLLSKAAGHP